MDVGQGLFRASKNNCVCIVYICCGEDKVFSITISGGYYAIHGLDIQGDGGDRAIRTLLNSRRRYFQISLGIGVNWCRITNARDCTIELLFRLCNLSIRDFACSFICGSGQNTSSVLDTLANGSGSFLVGSIRNNRSINGRGGGSGLHFGISLFANGEGVAGFGAGDASFAINTVGGGVGGEVAARDKLCYIGRSDFTLKLTIGNT